MGLYASPPTLDSTGSELGYLHPSIADENIHCQGDLNNDVEEGHPEGSELEPTEHPHGDVEEHVEEAEEEEEEERGTVGQREGASTIESLVEDWVQNVFTVCARLTNMFPELASIDLMHFVRIVSSTLGLINQSTLFIGKEHGAFAERLLHHFRGSNSAVDICCRNSSFRVKSTSAGRFVVRLVFQPLSSGAERWAYLSISTAVNGMLDVLSNAKSACCADAYASHPIVVLLLARMLCDILGSTQPAEDVLGIPRTSIAYRPEFMCFLCLQKTPIEKALGPPPAPPYDPSTYEIFMALAHSCAATPIWNMTDTLTKAALCYESNPDRTRTGVYHINSCGGPAPPMVKTAAFEEKAAGIYQAVNEYRRNAVPVSIEYMESVLDAASVGEMARRDGMEDRKPSPYRYAWTCAIQSSRKEDSTFLIGLLPSEDEKQTAIEALGLNPDGTIPDGQSIIVLTGVRTQVLWKQLNDVSPVVCDALNKEEFPFKLWTVAGMSIVSMSETVVDLVRAAMFVSVHHKDPFEKSLTNQGNNGALITAIIQKTFSVAQQESDEVHVRAARRTFLCAFFLWLNQLGNKTHETLDISAQFEYDQLFFAVRNILIFLPAALLPPEFGQMDGPSLARETLKELKKKMKTVREGRLALTSGQIDAQRTLTRILNAFFAMPLLFRKCGSTTRHQFCVEKPILYEVAMLLKGAPQSFIDSLGCPYAQLCNGLINHQIVVEADQGPGVCTLDNQLAQTFLCVANNLHVISQDVRLRAEIYLACQVQITKKGPILFQPPFDLEATPMQHTSLFASCYETAVKRGCLNHYRCMFEDFPAPYQDTVPPPRVIIRGKTALNQHVPTKTYFGTEAVLAQDATPMKRGDFIAHIFSIFDRLRCMDCATGGACHGGRVQFVSVDAELDNLPVNVINARLGVYDTYGQSMVVANKSINPKSRFVGNSVSNLGSAAIANCEWFRDAFIWGEKEYRKRSRI